MGIHPNLQALDEALAQSQAQNVREFLSYFRKLHPQDRLPGRDAFDPIELPRLLPDIVLARVVPSSEPGAPPRFLVKVAGERIMKSVDRPMIGRHLDEFITEGDQS
ncbi:PAS domain-containing protein, partial [Oceanibaculum nanhaiense]|uniref:PAS domain-containing protein n=1 Tax=Oceanibaculum nanhaiense TaxID=1909734 RepID=UPI00396E7D78